MVDDGPNLVTPEGLAQIDGMDEAAWLDVIEKMEARVAYDIEYLRNWSLGLDLVIILRTIKSIWADSKAY